MIDTVNLTTADLNQIRSVVRVEVESIVQTKLEPINDKLKAIKGELEAVGNDTKDTLFIVGQLQIDNRKFKTIAKLVTAKT